MTKSYLKLLCTGFILSIITAVFSCCSNPETGNTENSTQPAGSVEAYRLESEQIRPNFEGFGNLSFRRKVDITSAIEGTIKQLSAEEGDKVSEGQTLAVLNNIQLDIRTDHARAALFSAEAAYELAVTRYKEGRLQTESSLISIEKSELNLTQKLQELEHRQGLLANERKLFSIGGTTEESLASMELSFSALETEIGILRKDIQIKKIGFRDQDIIEYGYALPEKREQREKILIDINSLTLKSGMMAAEAELRAAETELQSAEALMNETVILSPISGIVGARYMETGERVRADDKLFTVFDSSEAELIFGVPEEIGVLLTPGQPVELSLDALKGRIFSAVIRKISPVIDAGSGNITVKAKLKDDDEIFRPGMFSRFSLQYGEFSEVIRLPAESLVRLDGSRGLVFSIINGRVYPRNVTVKTVSGGMHELTEGLEAGDSVVLNPSILLKEGDKVDVR